MTTETPSVELVGFDELAEALESAQELFKPFATKSIAISLGAIEDAISPYPPQPDRMRSGHFNTYVRGQGSYPKSAFVPDSQEASGFRIKPKTAAVKLTSQQMDKKFRSKVKISGKVITGELRNDASYSGWVLGTENKGATPHQVDFHTATGWMSTEGAIDKAKPTIVDSMNIAIGEFLRKVAGG